MAIDHFQKHNYQAGKIDWNFNIVFDDQPQVAEMLSKYSRLLNHPGLYPPIPGKWLHATVLRVGTTEEFSEEEMLAVVRALQSKLSELKLPEFMLGPWWMWGGSPALHIAPEEPLEELFNIVLSEIQDVVGIERTPKPSQFIPHVTMAYSRTYNESIGVYNKLLSAPIQPVSFRANHMPLIKQQIIDHVYQWEIIKDLELAQNYELMNS